MDSFYCFAKQVNFPNFPARQKRLRAINNLITPHSFVLRPPPPGLGFVLLMPVVCLFATQSAACGDRVLDYNRSRAAW